MNGFSYSFCCKLGYNKARFSSESAKKKKDRDAFHYKIRSPKRTLVIMCFIKVMLELFGCIWKLRNLSDYESNQVQVSLWLPLGLWALGKVNECSDMKTHASI